MALGSMNPGIINGLPNIRYFIPEDPEHLAYLDGHYLNGESTSVIQPVAGNGSYSPAGGALWPGNLVIVDTSSSNLAQPNVKRPSNVLTSVVLTDPNASAYDVTLTDSGAAGTFAAALYTFFYILKNASGQVTKRSRMVQITPTASHGVKVNIPNTSGAVSNASATSADVYCTATTTGGIGQPMLLLGNITAANFGTDVIFTAPPAITAAVPPADANTTANIISGLAGGQLGIVYQSSETLAYMPLDNAVPPLYPATVLVEKFIALLDANSFVSGQAPTTLGQKIYPASDGGATNVGLWSTTKVGTATQPDLALGTVIAFESISTYGGPGLQQTATVSGSPSQATQATAGGIQVARVRFNLPWVPGY